MRAQKRPHKRYKVTGEAINLKDFGAIPNDGIDVSDAIQQAIDATIESKSS